MAIEDDIKNLNDKVDKLANDLQIQISEAKSKLTDSQKWQMSAWLFGILLATAGALSVVLGVVFNSVAATTAKETAERVAIDRISDRLRKDPPFIKDVQTGIAVVPPGTVAAFDLASCPDGWSEFAEGAGRTLVGVGSGEGLSSRTLKETGGEESHTLTIEEMPGHRHTLPDTVIVARGQEIQLSQRASDLAYSAFVMAEPDLDYTSDEGDGSPHNNMPPYIALYLCKKD